MVERFEVRRELKIPYEEALRRVKNVEEIPKYWHGTRDLKIIKRDGGTYYVKVKLAFPGSSYYDAIITLLDNGIKIDYLSTTFFKGVQQNFVTEKELVSVWELELTTLGSLMKGWIINHFKEGTLHALMRINGEM